MKYHLITYRIVAVLFFVTTIGNTFANGTDTSIFDILSHQEVMNVEIKTNMEVLRSIRKSKDDVNATISFVDQQGQLQEWNAKLEARGHFRRMNCEDIPPLKVNFKKGDLRDRNLADFDDLKLVNTCVENQEEAQALLMKEYLAYVLYQRLSPYSFRVQLLKITYIDIVTGQEEEKLGFVIEDTAQLKARLNAASCKDCFYADVDRFQPESLKKMVLFQYMIGNADWSMESNRNLKILVIDSVLYPIPYDFDFSGMVNASYSIPNNNVGQHRIQDRVLMGMPSVLNDLDETIDFYKKNKAGIFDTVSESKFLQLKSRLEVKAYLKSFYKELDKLIGYNISDTHSDRFVGVKP